MITRKTRQSSATALKYLEQIKTKPEYEWKKIKHLQKDYSYYFMFCYYWNGIFNNRIHKLRFMDLNSKINIAWSDIEGLKQSSNEECRYIQERLDDLIKMRDYYKLGQVTDVNELKLHDKSVSTMERDDVYKELNDLTENLTQRNDDYLHNVKNEQTNLLYKIEEIIYEYHDLMWIANTPMKTFIDNYLKKRNKICNLKNLFMMTNQLPSRCLILNPNENTNSIKKKFSLITTEEEIAEPQSLADPESLELEINNENIHHLDTKYLSKYILDYNVETNDIDVCYSLGHNHVLINNEREIDIYNITSELMTIKEFIKVSVDTNDQLPFKVLLLFCNALLLIGEYVWNTVIKHEFNL